MRYVTLLSILFIGLASSATAASPSGWSPVIVATGNYRTQIQSMPIQHRPGRPLHVYGNTVRMMNQSGGVERVRPMRQIFLGSPTFRGNRSGRR